jgi:energy-coupling factor transporter ATP-binding protein EcfA2
LRHVACRQAFGLPGRQLLDEPSLGLAPVVTQAVFHIITEIHKRDTTVLLVEQNARMALKVANWGCVLETGRRLALGGDPATLWSDERICDAYAASRYNPDTNHLPSQEVAGNIARDIVQFYADRARTRELTGEWIVFAKHEGKNYYLCLAGHEEGDDDIFARIRDGCAGEFLFLGDLLNL